eukprot:scaffold44633_cov460-Skeletonema_marinoi.AAC.4
MNREPAANNGHRCRIMAATPLPLSRKMMAIISGTALDYVLMAGHPPAMDLPPQTDPPLTAAVDDR